MAKNEKNPLSAFIRQAMTQFQKALGEERVTRDATGIHLHFDLAVPEQVEQSTLLGNLGVGFRVKFFAACTGEDRMTVTIPPEKTYWENILELAFAMAKDAETYRRRDEDGAERKAITDSDPAFPIVTLTEMPWDRVKGGVYATDTVQPRLKGTEETQRRKLDYGMGLAMLPENGTTKLNILNWLNEQGRREADCGAPPKVAMPADWAGPSGIARIKSVSGNTKEAIRAAFKAAG